MSYHGRFEENKGKKPKKKAGKVILVIFLVLLLLVAGGVIWGVRYYNEMLGKMNIVTLDENLYETYSEETTAPQATTEMMETAAAATTEAVTETTVPTETTIPPFKSEDIINILVVGQAARAGEESHIADSTILVTVNTYDGTVRLSSVLRDTLVSLPNYKSYGAGRNKFNMAYHLGNTWEGIEGAMAYTNLTMYHNFGVEVDYNVEISFESFTKLIDYMGGVEMELTEAEAKYLNSDIKRTARQQKLIETLFNKIRHMSLSDLEFVADQLLPLITTTMTPKDVAELMIKMLPHIRDLKIEKGTIPIETTYWGELQEGYGSVLLFYPDQNKRLIREFTEGEPNPW